MLAFGMGLFGGTGSLGPGHHRVFALTSESVASDILLRFYDPCANEKVCTHNIHNSVIIFYLNYIDQFWKF